MDEQKGGVAAEALGWGLGTRGVQAAEGPEASEGSRKALGGWKDNSASTWFSLV